MRRLIALGLLLALSGGSATEAKDVEPSNTVICICNYASTLMERKKYAEAITVLEQVFKRMPAYELARQNLSVAYNNRAIECKDPAEAILNIQQAIALTPDDKNAEKTLEYFLHTGNIDVSSIDAKVKYADSLKEKGNVVGAYVEYAKALKDKDDPAIQKKIDDLISADDRSKATAVGGPGAFLLLNKIQLDQARDAAFKFDYLPYVRTVERKVHTCWKAPPTLGNRKVQIGFDTNAAGAVSNLKIAKSSGDKPSDAAALLAVKNAAPFKPLPADIFFTVPMTISLDARGDDESPVLYLNGEAKPDGVRFSTGAELNPMRVPKDVDAKLQAKSDAALSLASKAEKELAQAEQQFGPNSAKLCPKLRAAAAYYLQATEYQTAQERLTRAVTIAQAEKDDGERGLALGQLGSLYYRINKNADAETSLKQAVDLLEASPTRDAANLKAIMESYAKVLYKLNRVAEANQIYAKIKTLK